MPFFLVHLNGFWTFLDFSDHPNILIYIQISTVIYRRIVISFKDIQVWPEIYVGLLYIQINSPESVVVTSFTVKTQDLWEFSRCIKESENIFQEQFSCIYKFWKQTHPID